MRAPLLLLMAAASLAATPLARLNPWLSACDLEEEGAAAAARACHRDACSDRVPLAAHEARGLCATSAAEERQRRLRERRLRACCERDPLSALDARGRLEVAAGGARCERTLLDLIELDAMAARVHCAFFDILHRYDCQQDYSVHTCDECQKTYRRWACSTLLPFFISEEDLEHEGGWAPEPERRVRAERRASDARESGGGGGPAPARRPPPAHADPEGGRWRARHLERVGHLDRRRGGGVVGRWVRAAAAGPGRPAAAARLVRVKPCLSVCQLVEQHCPYFLPGDRAPAYPTQYAGEPTFLCLDSRIPETGEQKEHSNYGREECCYRHCGDELCHSCGTPHHLRLLDETPPARLACSAPEERFSTCVLPYNPAPPSPALAPAPGPQASRATRHRAPAPAVAAVVLLAALVPAALAAVARQDARVRSTRTDRTLLLVTNVHGARL